MKRRVRFSTLTANISYLGVRFSQQCAGRLLFAGLALLSACTNPSGPREPPVDPDAARAEIARLIPSGAADRANWAIDIFAAFEALGVRPTTNNICAVVAVTQQESTFQAQPSVPNLPVIAWREIDSRAARYNIPKFMVRAALQLNSPTGKSYGERIDSVKTEKELSDIFEDFIGQVPLGGKLFADWNPVRTGGPMQVSVTFAEQHVKKRNYPYPMTGSVRNEVFTRRGGIYFGMAHLFDYSPPYDEMLYRFADFNAGLYSSRNAAFQNAVNVLSKADLALDGDLLIHGDNAGEPSKTELAVRRLAEKLELSNAEIRRDLGRGDEEAFEQTKLYKRVFALADKTQQRPLPRAMAPNIRLKGAKITRNLSTEWFARRVDDRYKQCLKRAAVRGANAGLYAATRTAEHHHAAAGEDSR